MISVDKKKDSSPCLDFASSSVRKGVRNVVASFDGGAAAHSVLYSIYQAFLPACPCHGRRIYSDVRATDRQPHTLDDAYPVEGSLQRLSPHLLSRQMLA